MTRRLEQLRRIVRPAHVLGLIIALALAGGAAGTRTFVADREGSTRAFLIIKSDLGFHYGKFEEENGEPLVDNQLYRASGCNKLNRGTGPGTHQFLSPFLVELRGLDDLKNNDHVEMSIYSTEEGEAALKAADGSEVAYQTFTI